MPVENSIAKGLWDMLIQTDKLVPANQADIVVMEKEQKTVMMEVAVPCDSATSTRRDMRIWRNIKA